MRLEQDIPDTELLARIAGQDMTAMEALYHRHAPAVRRFIAQLIKDPFEVSDVLQTTMLDVWRKAGSFEGRSGGRTWVLSIARYKAIDHLRRHARVAPADPMSETLEEIDTQSAETALSAAQDAAALRACIAQLPDAQKTAIHLAFFQDLTYAEVAEIEGVPEGTVKTRIYHAKKLLMRCLASKSKKD
ncbi:MAG: sigma-70 family RNA polymerase sigma factor [Pseudomonadota bacterium]